MTLRPAKNKSHGTQGRNISWSAPRDKETLAAVLVSPSAEERFAMRGKS
jgi:hypothetical protein